jgi:RimJ/RimL family protein N-acetyltransferase
MAGGLVAAVIRLVDVYRGKIAPGAVEFLYELLKERPPEANISHGEMPTIEQHRGFVMRRPYRAWFIVENDEGERVGAVSVTTRNEVGIAILKAHQRKGYGVAAIEALLRSAVLAPASPSEVPRKLVANVAPGNATSRAMFEKMGCKLIQVTYEFP